MSLSLGGGGDEQWSIWFLGSDHKHIVHVIKFDENYWGPWAAPRTPAIIAPRSVRCATHVASLWKFLFFQVYQYFTIYRRCFLLKFEQFSWISYTILFKIRRYKCTKDHFSRVKVPGTTPYWTWCVHKMCVFVKKTKCYFLKKLLLWLIMMCIKWMFVEKTESKCFVF